MIKHKKIFIILISFILILYAMSNIVFCGDVETLVENFESKISTTGTGATEVESKAGEIVGLIRVVGTIASVAMITVLGIKYVLGSAEQKAEYKKTLFPYFVGAVLIFGATNLAQIIYNWVSKWW